MGYRSDIRFKVLKNDYMEMVKQFNEERVKLEEHPQDNKCMSNLFGETPTNDQEIIEFAQGKIDKINLYKDYEYYNCDEDKINKGDVVYFGWDWLKWYAGYADVDFIENFIFNLNSYAVSRIGEEMDDITERAKNMEYIEISRVFSED